MPEMFWLGFAIGALVVFIAGWKAISDAGRRK